MVILSDFPQLRAITWHLRAGTVLEEREAFEIYERHWRHVDVAALTAAEAALIECLTLEFGGGVRLV